VWREAAETADGVDADRYYDQVKDERRERDV
jgi:hypothetical protein